MAAENPKLDPIFSAAIAIPTEADRANYIARACGFDMALRNQVEQLVAGHFKAGSFMEVPVADLVETSDQPVHEGPGTVIGNYKLLEQIGEGGFGVVFMAQQSQPIQRKVAFKILKPGMDTRQIVARFEAERQALALMDNPHIARIFDGGQTASGRPYFVMELVRGIPITEYCDQSHLNVRERLGLFMAVCQAVQHAHQKGIIHRDIKPSNILVTMNDDRALVKVIDFGIAKAIGQQLTEKTLFTNFAQMIGTPLYMSPEQAQMSALDVDTRTDIYALGVLLYELLTGTTPFDKERLKTAGLDEMRRIIREEEPAKPSTRLSSMGFTAKTASANRQSVPKRLCQLFRGELDWIVMKALEKNRDRRYASASDFAADVRRYLTDEPVQARAPTMAYRLRKFLRRNKGPVLAASLVFLILLAGIAATTRAMFKARDAEGRGRDEEAKALREAENARRERDDKETALREAVKAAEKELKARQEADQTSDEALSTLRFVLEEIVEKRFESKRLSGADKAILNKLVEHYERLARVHGTSSKSLAIRAEGHFRMGRLRLNLEEVDAARIHLEQARDLFSRLADADPGNAKHRTNLARSCGNLALLQAQQGKWSEARTELLRAQELFRQLAISFPEQVRYQEDLAWTHYHLGSLMHDHQQWREMEAEAGKALRIWELLLKGNPRSPDYRRALVGALALRAGALRELSKRSDAEQAYRTALEIIAGLRTEFPQQLEYRKDESKVRQNFAAILADLGSFDDAEKEYRASIKIQRQVAAEFPGVPMHREDLAGTCNGLAMMLDHTGQLLEADVQFREALRIRKELADEFPTPNRKLDLAQSHNNLGVFLQNQKEWKEAEKEITEALKLKKQLADDYPKQLNFLQEVARTRKKLGTVLRGSGEPMRADEEYGKALAITRELIATNQNRGSVLFDAACICALMSANASVEAQREKYATDAIDFLRQALDEGYITDKRDIKLKYTDFDRLRDREDFKQLLTKLGKLSK